MSMWKNSNVFGLDTPRPPSQKKTRQISYYRYAWGQSKLLTSDDLWMVKMQCQRSDAAIHWPNSCLISPFRSTSASYVAENRISLEKIGRRLYNLWRHISVTWLNPVKTKMPKVARRMPHNPSVTSARTAERFRGYFRKLLGGCIHPPCTDKG